MINRIASGPNGKNARGNQRRQEPRFALGVKLSAEEKKHAGNAKQPMVKRVLKRRFARLSCERRPQIVEREQTPSRCPQKKVRLPFNAVNIRKETRHKRRGDQQRNGN